MLVTSTLGQLRCFQPYILGTQLQLSPTFTFSTSLGILIIPSDCSVMFTRAHLPMEPTCRALLWISLNRRHRHAEADHRDRRASRQLPLSTSPRTTMSISYRCPGLGQVLARLIKVASPILNTETLNGKHTVDTQHPHRSVAMCKDVQGLTLC